MPSPEASRDASSNVDGGGGSSGPAPSAEAATSCSAAAAQPTPPPTRPIPFNFLIPTEAGGATTTLTHAHAVPVSLLVPEPADTDLFVEVLGGALEARREQCRAAAPPACEVCYEAAQDVILTPVSFLHVNEEEVDAVGRQDEDGEDDDKAAAVAGEGLATAGPPSADAVDGQSAVEGEMSRAKREAGGGGKSKLGKRVDVLVTPVCGQPKCAALARRRVRSAMGGGGGGGEDGPEADGEGEDDDVTIAQGPEDPRCRTCGRTSGTRKCTGCGMVRYCGRDCQRADWKKGHKKMCQTFAALAEEARQVEEAQRE